MTLSDKMGNKFRMAFYTIIEKISTKQNNETAESLYG